MGAISKTKRQTHWTLIPCYRFESIRPLFMSRRQTSPSAAALTLNISLLCCAAVAVSMVNGEVGFVHRDNPNRLLDCYSTVRNWKDNFLSSFIFLLASCFSFVLAVARYAFEPTVNNLLNNLMKSVQDLMTDWVLLQLFSTIIFSCSLCSINSGKWKKALPSVPDLLWWD